MAELREDDEVTLVATITVRYTVACGDYENEDGSLPTDAAMAEADQHTSAADVFETGCKEGGVIGMTVRPESAR
jgi:hypothetical protein